MIDTVKFLIPIKERHLLGKIKGVFACTKREEPITNKIEFEYYTSEIVVGSHSRSVSLYLHDSDPCGLFVEFSLPKIKYGNNVEMIRPSDIIDSLEDFRRILSEHVEETLPPLSEWIVYRLDVCYNWTFSSKKTCESLLGFVQRIDFPRKKKNVYDTSITYRGTAYSIKFYLKGAEFLKHDFKHLLNVDESRAHELLHWAGHILRFEVMFRRAQLRVLFKKEKVYISDIINNTEIEMILQMYIDLVFRYVEREKIQYENVRHIISEHFSSAKALRLYQFYKGYYYQEDEKYHIERGLHSSTIWRYKKDLRSVGVPFGEELESTALVPIDEFIIPSPKGHFTLLDYKSSEDYSL
jgi:hypothetical protein